MMNGALGPTEGAAGRRRAGWRNPKGRCNLRGGAGGESSVLWGNRARHPGTAAAGKGESGTRERKWGSRTTLRPPPALSGGSSAAPPPVVPGAQAALCNPASRPAHRGLNLGPSRPLSSGSSLAQKPPPSPSARRRDGLLRTRRSRGLLGNVVRSRPCPSPTWLARMNFRTPEGGGAGPVVYAGRRCAMPAGKCSSLLATGVFWEM